MLIQLALIFGFFYSNLILAQESSLLNVVFGQDKSSFQIFVNGQSWFSQNEKSSKIFVTSNTKTFSNRDGSLVKAGEEESNGFDVLGNFNSTKIQWNPSEVGFTTELRTYQEEPMIVFSQRFQKALNGTNNGKGYNHISTSYPSLAVASTENLGQWSFGGTMAGWAALSVTNANQLKSIRDGHIGGPIAFFDRDYTAVVIVSPLNQYMVASTEVDSEEGLINFGLMASVKSIPEDETSIEFVMVGGTTFDEAFTRWGTAMRKYHGKSLNTPKDVAREYLGFWTDNGAYYYYKTLEPNVNYEDTLIELYGKFLAKKLPMKYIEIDSWWYFKSPVETGVTSWTAMPELFPNGLDRVQQETGWPVVAHNRYWSGLTNYSTENGGDYHFIIEKDSSTNRSIALPQDPQFWSDLFRDSKKWGLEMYEQDWLDVQYLLMNTTHEDFYAAYNWLYEMGHGAKENNILIKYCMALPRHILTSAAIESVNAARTSGDYRLSKDNWRIGLSGYMSNSLGLYTFKDSFWSSPRNPDHPFYYECMIGDEADPNVPWTVSYRYNGYKGVSKSGKQCVSWYDLDLHFTSPNNDLERNACRNAMYNTLSNYGEGKPWCFTNASLDRDPSTWEWESCDIPICNKDCRRGSEIGDHPNLPECELIPEPNPEREAVVSILSKGGVGPGDRYEYLDSDIILPTCDQDGKLLMADVPVKAAPIQILNMAFSNHHNPRVPHSLEQGEIWISHTTLMDSYDFSMIFMSETQNVGQVDWKQLGLVNSNLKNADSYVGFFGPKKLDQVRVIRYQETLSVPNLESNEYKIFYLTPVWKLNSEHSGAAHFVDEATTTTTTQVALLGELDKYVLVSKDRIKNVSLNSAKISMELSGSPDEQLRFGFAMVEGENEVAGVVDIVECMVTLGPSGQGQLVFDIVHYSC